jgi:hypothetical protein
VDPEVEAVAVAFLDLGETEREPADVVHVGHAGTLAAR